MEKEVISKQAIQLVLNYYWQEYKNHPWYTLIGFLLPALGTIFVVFVPPLIVATIINIITEDTNTGIGDVWGLIAAFGGLWLFGEILWRVGLHFLIKMEAIGLNNLSKKAYDKLLERDYSFYSNNFVGSLTKKSMAFTRSFETFSDTLVFNITTNILPIIFAFVVLWRYSPWIPLMLLVWLVIAVSIVIPLAKIRSRLVAQRHLSSSRVAGRLADSVTNMMAIKSFATERQESNSFGKYVDDFSTKFVSASNFHNLIIDSLTSPVYVLTNVFGLIAAIYFTQTLNLEPGVIVVVFAYYSQISHMFWQINRVYRNIESSISEAAEFTQLIVNKPAIEDKVDANHLKVSKANIDFKNIEFKYSDARKSDVAFLKNFNMRVNSNQKVGLVGPSGGGKTTITKLLLRYIDLVSGEITIDGQNISEVTQTSLRKNISYVPQEPLLFHRSLLENIAYGRQDATEKEIIEASKIAHAHEFIEKLPQGYDTLVGERGIKLSGGQRQRVAIARALLKDAPILVLDEATSSLDSESEKYIQDGLWHLMKNKTAVVIAHRLSTIKHLDRIIVLDEGKIIEDGTHEELLEKNGLYARLWSHQSVGFIE